MNTASAWHTHNQTYLLAALERVRRHLAAYEAGQKPENNEPLEAPVSEPGTELYPLDVLCLSFELTAFERDLLLVCAGIELDAPFARLVAKIQGGTHSAPNFSLALAALPGAHWSALSPDAPLRRWRLIQIGAGESLVNSPIRIDEWTLHFLTGVFYLDEQLQEQVERVFPEGDLSPSHAQVADKVSSLWQVERDISRSTLVLLTGSDTGAQRQIAATICAHLSLRLYALPAAHLPTTAAGRDGFARLWEREAGLSGSVLLVDMSNADSNAMALGAMLIQRIQARLFVLANGPLETTNRKVLHLDVVQLPAAEQKALWQQALGEHAARLNGSLDSLVAQFNLSAASIHLASEEVLSTTSGQNLKSALWQACRSQARPQLDDLASRIQPGATWDDLVLPLPQMELLRSIAAHVRQRARVYETWGFARRSSRGLGISTLFAGASGTGKTMAAEVLAQELDLDLYRIDLSAMVSKYIGETEKNLRRVFDAAESGGAILLFDEADALFGKRSEVQDSHDRYANIEVSYLLQRMEAYRGLAILTTNMKSALDNAFLRRIRFIVNFPFPDQEQRAEIWRRIFPQETPTHDLDMDKLARLTVTGGSIRNIALHAAFLAADEGSSVSLGHCLQAARSEYAKMEKVLTEAEVRAWK